MASNIKIPINPGRTGWKEILPTRTVNQNLSDNINADYLTVSYTHLTLPTTD